MGSPHLEENKKLVDELVEVITAFNAAHANVLSAERLSSQLSNMDKTAIGYDELRILYFNAKSLVSTIQETQQQETLERPDWEKTVMESYNKEVEEYFRERNSGGLYTISMQPPDRPRLTDDEYQEYREKIKKAKKEDRFLPFWKSDNFTHLKLLANRLGEIVQREREYEAEQRRKELNDKACILMPILVNDITTIKTTVDDKISIDQNKWYSFMPVINTNPKRSAVLDNLLKKLIIFQAQINQPNSDAAGIFTRSLAEVEKVAGPIRAEWLSSDTLKDLEAVLNKPEHKVYKSGASAPAAKSEVAKTPTPGKPGSD